MRQPIDEMQERHLPPGGTIASMADRWLRREAAGVALLVALLAIVSLHRLYLMQGEVAPPGSDGGNWLAFSRELFGDRVKAAPAAYPPVFPLLLRGATWLMPEMFALKIAGLLAASVVSIPAYLLLRTALRPPTSALLAAAVAAADYPTEMLAWGGYPQLLGTGFLLLSVYHLLQGLHTGRTGQFVLSALWAGATVGTHILAAALLVPALSTALALHAYDRWGTPATRWLRPLVRPLLFWGIVAGLLALLAAPVYIKIVTQMVGNPANPQGFRLFETLWNFGSWRAAHYMWLVVAAVGVPAALWSVLTHRRPLLAGAAVAMLVSGVTGLTLQNEIRSLHLLEIGLGLSTGVAVSTGWEYASQQRQGFGPTTPRTLVAAALALFLAGVAFFGGERAVWAYDWYRVVDTPALAAMDWLKGKGQPGERAVANQTPKGGIYGWWLEGYAGVPTYMAIDTRWLSFREERDQAEIAHRLLDPWAAPQDLRELARSHDIRFLFLDSRTAPTPGPRYDLAGFLTVFKNETFTILLRLDEGLAQ